ncbi:MAG TPA: fumarate hydratase [Armatimonadetes bacterium]|jgi:tartrate/fumarate subfamily iron-sulfur-dependent hydro-lyase beta chain|nr:fumarate hydratase [Armatimonadota bacterium]
MDTEITHLNLPLSEDQARGLRIGQMVTVTGPVFTGRSRFHIRAIEDGIIPPLDFSEVNCFFHVGPVMRQEGDEWRIVSIEPTSSIRFERYGADVVRKLGLRTLIGKTTMGPRTVEALAEVGGIYLSKIGICGNQLAPQVTRVVGVHFLEELGKTEATWVFEVERFGPFFVAIDAHGNSYFEDLNRNLEDRMPQLRRRLGIPEDYQHTDVGGSVCS